MNLGGRWAWFHPGIAQKSWGCCVGFKVKTYANARTGSANKSCCQGFPLSFDLFDIDIGWSRPGELWAPTGKGLSFLCPLFIFSFALDQHLPLLPPLQGLPAGFMTQTTLVLACTGYGAFSAKTWTVSGKPKGLTTQFRTKVMPFQPSTGRYS